MKIALETKITKSTAILCMNGSTKYWVRIIKLQLKHHGIDGINILNGIRHFILTLDEVMTVGKVCKS